jgi:dephospho-CoA kinase
MKVIGLTGGIGSGKSTVSGFLAELGAVIIDVDRVGHEALKTDEARKRLAVEFGKGILTASGEIDRTKLGKLVFNHRESLERLNQILHPIIFNMVDARLEEYRRQGADEVVLEAPLMLEVGRSSQVQEVWVTVAPEATVLRRIRERTGLSEPEALARIRAQLPSEERIKHADVVIDTDCSLDELKNRVLALWMRNKTRFASFDVP